MRDARAPARLASGVNGQVPPCCLLACQNEGEGRKIESIYIEREKWTCERGHQQRRH